MKASQFSSEQIIKILERAERGEQTIGTICREQGITETAPGLQPARLAPLLPATIEPGTLFPDRR